MFFTFSETAKKDVSKLTKNEQARLRKKLIYWQNINEPLTQAKVLKNHEATHRFRLGSFRILIVLFGKNEMRILKIRHRKDVYKR